MNWLKNLFKKKEVISPKFKVVRKTIKLQKKVQESLIKLRNGEFRQLRRISDTADPSLTQVDLETGKASTRDSTFKAFITISEVHTLSPEQLGLASTGIFSYLDDQGNRVFLQVQDVQEIIIYPVRPLPETFETQIWVLEKI